MYGSGGSMSNTAANQSAQGTGATPARLVGLFTLTLALAALIPHFVSLLGKGTGAIAYPFQLDYGEGQILNVTHILSRGQAVYRPVGEAPYALSNYPPVFHVVAAGLDLVLGDTLAAGRVVSFVSILLSAVVIAVLVWRASGSRCWWYARALAALAAGLLFLAVDYTGEYGILMRVDAISVLFALAGTLAFLHCGPRSTVWVSAVLFLLAVYSRQSMVAAAAACLAVALTSRPRLGWRLAGHILFPGLAVFLALEWASGGNFYANIIAATRHGYSWDRAASFLSEMIRTYPAALFVAVVGAVGLVGERPLAVPSRRAKSDGDNVPAPDDAWDGTVLGTYLATSFLVALTVGKIGSDVDYLIEFMAVASACAGVVIARSLSGLWFHAPRSPRWADAASLVLPAALLWQSTLGLRHVGPGVEIPDAFARRNAEQHLLLVKQTPGAVLSDDLTLLVLAGKRVEFAPFEMTQLAHLGKWDQSPFLQSIERREFRLLALHFNIFSAAAPWQLAFTPEMIDAMRRHYRIRTHVRGCWFYVPAPHRLDGLVGGGRAHPSR